MSVKDSESSAMDESKSISNATSQLELQTKFQTLPPELKLVTFRLLSRKDQQNFSLLSQSCRQLALPTLFRKLVYYGKLMYRIKRLNGARGDVKAVIRELVLNDDCYMTWDYKTILFPFLRTLPNLQCFRWNHSLATRHQPFPELVASLQHCPLEHLTYWGPRQMPKEPVTGPPRLRTLSIIFHHSHIYDLIRPSFSTLVELEIYPGPVVLDPVILDLLPLRPVGRTLRKFVYRLDGFDPDILDTIPDVFPHLTTLELMVRSSPPELQWKNSYDDALAKNTRLQHLAVFAYDFIFCDSNARWIHSNCTECEDQRNRATQLLAMACSGLERCRWDHKHAQYCFNIRMSSSLLEGNTPQIDVVLDIDEYNTEPFMGHCH